jgi:ABC-type polysaccharide/polyol phosphate export permease
LEELRELIRYKDLVILMVRRDVVTRYKRSVLGIAWTMLNPLLMMIILSVVFSQVFGAGPEFPVYVLSALTMWNFFSSSSSDAMTNLIGGVVLRQRVYMPSTIFALTAVGNGLVNVVFSFIPLMIVMVATHVPITWAMLFLPVPMLIGACFALGIGLLVSTLAVYFRDITAMYSIVLSAWFYLNPIVYPAKMLGKTLETWLPILNPMYNIIDLFRQPILNGQIPPLPEIGMAAVIAVVSLLVGWFVFTRKADEFAYRI